MLQKSEKKFQRIKFFYKSCKGCCGYSKYTACGQPFPLFDRTFKITSRRINVYMKAWKKLKRKVHY